MPAKLGEMLLRAGALNEAQLEQVLGVQSFYGGRLGTNLIEMGLVGEDELARLLNEKLGVPSLDASALDSIPQEVLNVIPLDMVRRHRTLPVAVEGDRLFIAMADPTDAAAIEEIGFVTGLVVVPRVCSELRLAVALEHYCGIARSVRYVPISAERESHSAGTGTPRSGADADLELRGHSTAHTPAAKRVEASGDRSQLPEQSQFGQGAARLCKPAGKRVSVAAVGERLAAATGEAEVVTALLAYLHGEFDGGAFLGVQHGNECGTQVLGIAAPSRRFAGGAIALADTEQLQRVVRESRPCIGELPMFGGDGRLLREMGVSAGAAALLVPMTVSGQVVAVLCASGQPGVLAAAADELQQVAAKAELALEMLCLRKRIRTG